MYMLMLHIQDESFILGFLVRRVLIYSLLFSASRSSKMVCHYSSSTCQHQGAQILIKLILDVQHSTVQFVSKDHLMFVNSKICYTVGLLYWYIQSLLQYIRLLFSSMFLHIRIHCSIHCFIIHQIFF